MPLVMDPSTGQPTMLPDQADPGMGMAPPDQGPPPDQGMQDPGQGATAEDWINVAIEAARRAADASDTDAIETADVMKIVSQLHALLGKRAKEEQAAMGGGPATNFLKRTYNGG